VEHKQRKVTTQPIVRRTQPSYTIDDDRSSRSVSVLLWGRLGKRPPNACSHVIAHLPPTIWYGQNAGTVDSSTTSKYSLRTLQPDVRELELVCFDSTSSTVLVFHAAHPHTSSFEAPPRCVYAYNGSLAVMRSRESNKKNRNAH
jgi:hypothetical protein